MPLFRAISLVCGIDRYIAGEGDDKEKLAEMRRVK